MEREALLHTLAVARGDAPADLLLRNARVVNVFTGEVQETDVALAGGTIAALGPGGAAQATDDLGGRYLVPGLIDSHVHIESSMVGPLPFARAVVPRGVTTIVADPHEIANVCGAAGIRYMIAASEGLPLEVLVNLPSCVPATPLGTAGAALEAADLAALRDLPRVLGLAEFMNVPGAVLGHEGPLAKLLAFRDRPFGRGHVDGHAPGVDGAWLQAYAAAGPSTDHECLTAAEATAKARAGFFVLVREATAARNLRDLLPAITPANAARFAFATDDRHPADLLDEGSIDHLVRLAVANGLDPILAVRMATLHAAEAFGLRDRGAVAPGRRADLAVVDTLESFRVLRVYAGGRLVARDGAPQGDWPAPATDEAAVRGSVRVDAGTLSFWIPAEDGRLRVIGLVPDQIVTEARLLEPRIEGGEAMADPERDLIKLAVVERHGRGGHVGLGFVQGLGLRRGALAGTVAHDCHNLVVAGVDDGEMRAAARAVTAMGGGLAAVRDGEPLAALPLPIGGLMSDRPLAEVRAGMDALLAAARALGSPLHAPFMQLGFLALEVIPALKLTDRGLVDVTRFAPVPLWEGSAED